VYSVLWRRNRWLRLEANLSVIVTEGEKGGIGEACSSYKLEHGQGGGDCDGE
jgi:hypothetical protein